MDSCDEISLPHNDCIIFPQYTYSPVFYLCCVYHTLLCNVNIYVLSFITMHLSYFCMYNIHLPTATPYRVHQYFMIPHFFSSHSIIMCRHKSRLNQDHNLFCSHSAKAEIQTQSMQLTKVEQQFMTYIDTYSQRAPNKGIPRNLSPTLIIKFAKICELT